MARGRPRKPVETLKVTGQYRPDRHSQRARGPQFDGEPSRPKGLDKDERWLWDQVVGQLTEAGVAKRIDTASLRSLCEMWGLYRKALEEAKKDPVDKPARTAVTAYWGAFCRLGAQFGLTPVDRQRLTIDQPANDSKIEPRKRA